MNWQLATTSLLFWIWLSPSIADAKELTVEFSSAVSETSLVRTQVLDTTLTPSQDGSLPGRQLGEISADSVKAWLEGYNYAVVWQAGKMQRIVVSGESDRGSLSRVPRPTPSDDLFDYVDRSSHVPGALKRALPGSVRAIDISPSRLMGMKLGETLTLKLPTGEFRVVHDNRYIHDNGDTTWIGYLDEAGKGYRVILTVGVDGLFGQIVSPEGAYDILSEDSGNWLVDLGASGFLAGGSEQDGIEPGLQVPMSSAVPDDHAAEFLASANPVTAKAKAANLVTARMRDGASLVDVLVLYPKGASRTKLDSRVNYLLAKTNQAYIDSGVNMVIRVVAKEAVKYGNTTTNVEALNELSAGNGAFSKVPKLRAKYGADLVSLIRPFRYSSQKSCGVAWVNGAMGSRMDASLAFSVVSDGVDPSGWYCSDFTFAHELGHNMGSVHDRGHSTFSGVLPYSYGYGQAGRFGTIMSYYDPVVGFFSSPNLICAGQACGVADLADNVRSLNLAALVISGFVEAKK